MRPLRAFLLAASLFGATACSSTSSPTYDFDASDGGKHADVTSPPDTTVHEAGSDVVSRQDGADGADASDATDARVDSGVDACVWCLSNAGAGGTWNAVWGATPTDVWVVGENGAAAHFLGSSWQPVVTPTSANLASLWGSSADDVWAVGEGGTILRWNGDTWTSVASPTTAPLYAVYGGGEADVYVAGGNANDAELWHWDGMKWQPTPLPDLFTAPINALWVQASQDSYLLNVLSNGVLYYWEGLGNPWFPGSCQVSGPPGQTAYTMWVDPALNGGGTAWLGSPTDAVYWNTTSCTDFGQGAGGAGIAGLAIWGASNQDVWVGYEHWNGSSWEAATTTPTLLGFTANAAYGFSTSDVWEVGTDQVIVHWDGVAWTRWYGAQPSTLTAAWGSSTSDVWAVGSEGTVSHWGGAGWLPAASGTREDLSGVSGSSTMDVWAVGQAGTAIHWNGVAWTAVTTGIASDLAAVWSGGAGDVWAVGAGGAAIAWNGASWSSVPSGTTLDLSAVWGSASDDVWAVGDEGTILHWDGAVWSPVPSGTTESLYDVWGTSSTSAWAVGALDGSVLEWNGASWMSVPIGQSGAFVGVWGLDAEHLWVASASDALLFFDGVSWSSSPTASASSLPVPAHLLGGEAVGTEAWAVGQEGLLVHAIVEPGDAGAGDAAAPRDDEVASGYNPQGTYLGWNAAWEDTPSDVWVVGNAGALLHWNGSAWSSPTVPTAMDLRGVWGTGPTDAWIVGGAGVILHWDGTAWTLSPSGVTSSLQGVWASSPDDAWAVGIGGVILEWNGAAWNPSTSGVGNDLHGVWGSAPGDVWAVGSGGLPFVHWNGTAWSPVTSGVMGDTTQVWGTSSTDVWAMGDDVGHWDGTSWTELGPLSTLAPSTQWVATGVWGPSSSTVWSCGASSMTATLFSWTGGGWIAADGGVACTVLAGSGSDTWAVGGGATSPVLWHHR